MLTHWYTVSRLVNLRLPGCYIARIANRQRTLFVLALGSGNWTQCCQDADKLLQVMMMFSLQKALNISGHPLTTFWSGHFVVSSLMWKHVRTANNAPDSHFSYLNLHIFKPHLRIGKTMFTDLSSPKVTLVVYWLLCMYSNCCWTVSLTTHTALPDRTPTPVTGNDEENTSMIDSYASHSTYL